MIDAAALVQLAWEWILAPRGPVLAIAPGLWLTGRLLLGGGGGGVWITAAVLARSWVVLVATAAVAAVALMPGWNSAYGVPLIFAAAAVLQIPAVITLACLHLRVGLWRRMYVVNQAEELQCLRAPAAAGQPPSAVEAEDAISEADRSMREEVAWRLADERLFEMPRHPVAECVLGLSILQPFLEIPESDALCEVAFLYGVSLVGWYSWQGFDAMARAGLSWSPALLAGAAVGALAIVAQIAISRVRRRRLEQAPSPCVLCEEDTSRRMPAGDFRPHVCSEACEQELRRLAALA